MRSHLFVLVGTVLLISISAHAQSLPQPATNAALLASLAQHGGDTVRAVTRVRIQGQSSKSTGTSPVVISVDLAGNSRVDYGNPITRSLINTANGVIEIANGKTTRKPPHVEIFSQLDLVSVFGLLRLQTGNVSWTDLGPGSVGGRAAVRIKADTGQTRELYRRVLRDQAELRFDTQTGLLSSITRTHYSDRSLDNAAPITTVFSDHRTVNGIVFPFRIDVYFNTALFETITVTNIEFNPALASDIFER